jgi:hypothetical protein
MRSGAAFCQARQKINLTAAQIRKLAARFQRLLRETAGWGAASLSHHRRGSSHVLPALLAAAFGSRPNEFF